MSSDLHSTDMPLGFSLRSQGGSTFLEVDLSHLNFDAIRDMAWQMSKLRGWSDKPVRRAKSMHRAPQQPHYKLSKDQRARLQARAARPSDSLGTKPPK